MRLSDFDFDLPQDRIALRPASPRDSARLLVVRPRSPLQDRSVSELPELLCPGDALVFNDTKVIPARLFGVRERDGARAHIEATLHKRLGPERWTAFLRPGKRLKPGDRIRFGETSDMACMLNVLDATLVSKGEDGEVVLAFDLSGPALDSAVAELGVTPLPPYIAAQRPEDERDRLDYQTVYARQDGSVAAPTAGLHFTPELLQRLDACGVRTAFVTLHVGAGTFMPVKTEVVEQHRMHAESGQVSETTAALLNETRRGGGRMVCVGTTSLRLLESATDDTGFVHPFAGETDIFIKPGYRFRAADALLTNFHLPKSTLLMLVAALAGLETVKAAYAHAVASGYRFYSYGDAGLWFRKDAA